MTLLTPSDVISNDVTRGQEVTKFDPKLKFRGFTNEIASWEKTKRDMIIKITVLQTDICICHAQQVIISLMELFMISKTLL